MKKDLTGAQLKQFELYKENLLKWNKRINLTAIKDEEDIWQRHFFDSLTLLPFLSEKVRTIDVGSGAGFPGLPIKIMRPDINMTLLDSLRKRVIFLEDTISLLGLCDIVCVHSRAEDFVKLEGCRGGYDVCTARAVARLEQLCKWSLPFLAPGGLFLAMKGPKADDEVKEAKGVIQKLGGEVVGIERVEIGPGRVHSVVIVCYTG